MRTYVRVPWTPLQGAGGAAGDSRVALVVGGAAASRDVSHGWRSSGSQEVRGALEDLDGALRPVCVAARRATVQPASPRGHSGAGFDLLAQPPQGAPLRSGA